MNKLDKLTFGMALIALALSLISISLNAFKDAGIEFLPSMNMFLAFISGIVAIIFVIFGIKFLLEDVREK